MADPRTAPVQPLSIEDARERLRVLIRDLAVVRGHVVLSSGAEADHYVDLRRVTLHHEAAPLVGRVMLDLLRGEGLIPASRASESRRTSAGGGATAPLDAFDVRKANKAHGPHRRIEGPDVTGRRVGADEGTSTTGGSVLTACEALTEAGADIAAVAVIA